MQTGKTIKLLRTAEGCSQARLARDLGKTGAYVSQVENGRREPSLSFLKQVAARFKVPLALLIPEAAGENAEILRELQKILSDVLAARVGIRDGDATGKE